MQELLIFSFLKKSNGGCKVISYDCERSVSHVLRCIRIYTHGVVPGKLKLGCILCKWEIEQQEQGSEVGGIA